MEPRRRNGIVRGSDLDGEKLALARRMRRVANPAERAAWEELRGRRCFGLKFRRQQVIDGFVADFFCDARRLVVEVDGGVHDDLDQQLLDERRTAVFERRGLRVLGIRDREVLEGRLRERLGQSLDEPP